jgi:regulator of sirC expression with transglutaminase-like and TPR domain
MIVESVRVICDVHPRMKVEASTGSPGNLTENQLTALISLLGDEDQAVYETVRAKLLSYGSAVCDPLQRCTLSDDPLLRRRAQELVDFFGRQASDTAFVSFCLKQGEDFDIEEGALLLARTRYPSLNAQAYSALLDSFAAHLKERVAFAMHPERMIAAINHYLFDELGFSGNEENYYDPDNSYLNQVIDRRTGNPISLCLVYLLLGKRLQLPLAGIGLPGHFVCRFQSATDELYIDAFNGGKLLTKADCIQYLIQTNHSLQAGYLSPVTPRRILLRICANLHQIYSETESEEETSRIQRYIVALAK